MMERASERPGKARKASIYRKFDGGLRQKVPFIGKKRPSIVSSCRADRTRRCLGIGRKVASRNRLVELYCGELRRRASRKTPGALQRRPKNDAAPAGGGRAKKKDTRADAAAAGARVRWTTLAAVAGVCRVPRLGPPSSSGDRRVVRPRAGSVLSSSGLRRTGPLALRARYAVTFSSVPPGDGAVRPSGSLCRREVRGTSPSSPLALALGSTASVDRLVLRGSTRTSRPVRTSAEQARRASGPFWVDASLRKLIGYPCGPISCEGKAGALDPQDRSARSAYQVAHSKSLGQGITERASERPGKARKASIRRKFDSSLRQRAPFVTSKRAPWRTSRSCRGPNSTGSSEWDEK
ncbi:hypothetical protein THAOC_14551 [Thalassiosira oceanica]|uniref:Uncharacterized protein n=1 Tax=Thalassiosira oceanica TaxID=159749 RepID=K0SUP1_THAOC|nr:hypothetical protein THAOC_14551 [Thalassiosira oceanica]|eukprot:EJK64691.1 hypothetical protein THAOC_14551 [Thalassiosira oceanica]